MELHQFIDEVLPSFGDYQDAMVAGQPYMYHSLVSCYLNAGLLRPLEICQLAEDAYRQGLAPLNAVEGFIRQILGWREYVRGSYWLHMPEFGTLNYLGAKRPLPKFLLGRKHKHVLHGRSNPPYMGSRLFPSHPEADANRQFRLDRWAEPG